MTPEEIAEDAYWGRKDQDDTVLEIQALVSEARENEIKHWFSRVDAIVTEEVQKRMAQLRTEIGEEIAQEIENVRCDSCGRPGNQCTGYVTERACSYERDQRRYFARIARGGK